MKKLITITMAVLVAGAAYAGCGTKIPVEGKISKYDAEKKMLTIGTKDITLDASVSIKDASGKRAKLEDLVGQEVMVSTDKHTKRAESVLVKEDESAKSAAAEKPAMKSNLLAESQDWTNKDGVKITAAVQKVESGKVYFMMNGKVIPYDVPKLSDETIARLKEILAKSKEKAADKPKEN